MLVQSIIISVLFLVNFTSSQTITCSNQNETARLATCDVTCDDLVLQCNYPDSDRLDCFCKEGYVRNRRKECILIADCESNRCGVNEVYRINDCDNHCDPRKRCDSGPYRMDCWCIEEYVRDGNNQCIPRSECGKCQIDEEYRKDRCDRGCYSLNDPCPDVEEYFSCWCKEGLVRDETNNCIPADQCKQCPGENEVYREGTCDSTCGRPGITCFVLPHPGCFCKEGYVKNIDGNCIPVENCGKCDGQNEEYKMGYCDDKCDRRDYICPLAPTRMGCWCREGHARDGNGACVPLYKCPRCGNDEEFKFGRCDERCDGQTYCTPGTVYEDCWCKTGLVRDDRNICIPPDTCPGRCKYPNEEYRFGRCDATCSNPEEACPDAPFTQGCWCKEGTLRSSSGDCVTPDNCSRSKCKGENEEYRKDTCDGACEYPERKEVCKFPERFDCFCLDGYLRDKDGKCVLANECVMLECGENEYLNKCPGFCTFDPDCLSEFDGIFRVCGFPFPGWVCSPRCRCQPGFLRIDGKCVKPDKCCEDKNEVAVPCPAPCDRTTTGLPWDKCEQSACGRIKFRCRCKKGFLRNPDNQCVRKKKPDDSSSSEDVEDVCNNGSCRQRINCCLVTLQKYMRKLIDKY